MEQAREAAQVVSEFFQGNPFATPVGKKLEDATDGSLASENWVLNMEICDLINMTDEGPRDSVRALRRRLQTQMGKNNQSVMYCLTVLETCVKNCDRRFHQLVCQKEFIEELVKLIGPKYDPPQVVQEKVLSLIQGWADAFRGQHDLQGVCEVYADLKSKGVEFPMTDLDSMAPILTPQRSITTSNPPIMQQQYPTAQQSPQQQYQPSPSGYPTPVTPSSEQLTKLRSELDIVQGNLRVLREMLSELAPGQEAPDDLTLLQELYNTSKAMQHRVLQLLESVANEEVTNELLLINDELNNVNIKYDRYMGNRKQSITQTQPPSEQKQQPSLIDLGAGDSLANQLAGLDVTAGSTAAAGGEQAQASGGQKDDFDMFAQTRSTTFEQSRLGGSTYADNTTGLDQINLSLGTVTQQRANTDLSAPPEKEQDIQEMEKWLKDQPGAQGTMTAKDFDKFLSGRAQSGEETAQRQAKAKEDEEQKLFAL